MPERIQRRRTKGWRTPPDTVYVGRPSVWGNPFLVKKRTLWEVVFDFGYYEEVLGQHDSKHEAQVQAVALFERWFSNEVTIPMHEFRIRYYGTRGYALAYIAPKLLRGKNLSCWCALDEPCHADVLLRLANKEE